MSLGWVGIAEGRHNVPLLGPVPADEERDWDEDDDGFSAVADLDLCAIDIST